MIDYIKNNKILLVIGLIIIIAIFLIVMAIIPNRMYYSEEMSIDPDVVEVDEEELEYQDSIDLGYTLYEEATNIYSMNPYCGISYDKITKKRIVNQNGIKYYKSDFHSKDELINKLKTIVNNPSINTNDMYEKDGYLYCKYVEPIKSKTYINEYYLVVKQETDNQKVYEANLSYLKNQTKDCSIENTLDCRKENKTIEKSNFVIEKNNNQWMIKEFHLYH